MNVDEASDQARFTEVFVPYLVDAFRLAHWLAGSREDAEDAGSLNAGLQKHSWI